MREIALALCLLTFGFAVTSDSKPNGDHPPREGFVATQRTAIRIAEAVLTDIYGEEQVRAEQPFSAALENGVWTVTGHFPDNIRFKGGVATISIVKSTGCILSVSHTK